MINDNFLKMMIFFTVADRWQGRNMVQCIYEPSLSCVISPGYWRWCNGVGSCFLAYVGPATLNIYTVKNLKLNLVVDHVHPDHNFQNHKDQNLQHKAQKAKNPVTEEGVQA